MSKSPHGPAGREPTGHVTPVPQPRRELTSATAARDDRQRQRVVAGRQLGSPRDAAFAGMVRQLDALLGVHVGTLTFNIGSLHLYEQHRENARTIEYVFGAGIELTNLMNELVAERKKNPTDDLASLGKASSHGSIPRDLPRCTARTS